MSAFTSRTGTYKFGLFFFYFAFLLFVVGDLAPYWASLSYEYFDLKYNAFEGPWAVCTDSRSNGSSHVKCVIVPLRNLSIWVHAVRALELFAFITLLAAFVHSIKINCCSVFSGLRTRTLEILVTGGGVFGLVGVIVYGASQKDNSIYSAHITDVSGSYRTSSGGIITLAYEIDWAIYVTGVGSGLLLASAIVIALGNKPANPPAQTGNVALGMTSVGQAAGANLGYPGYPPTQPWSVQQPGYPVQGGGNPQAPPGDDTRF